MTTAQSDPSRRVALGRKNYLSMGCAGGCKSAAIAHTPIEPAKPNGVDPQAWRTDTGSHRGPQIARTDELRP